MTYRNRSRWGLGLLALMLLTFGLAGCGGDEPAAVMQPPAPPPAPPPFVPQAVEVALGESGDTLTLMTTEAGGYTLNGEAFAGGEVMAEMNGSTYTLTLDGTTWSAAYKAPEAMSLSLGISDTSISIERLEDGSYVSNGSPIENGSVVTAANGNQYTVMISDDGMFTAEFVQQAALSVPLGASGSTIEARITEARTFEVMINGEWVPVTAETMVTAENGNMYGVQFVNGVPMPVYIDHVATVMLGSLGGEIMLTRAEDMSWWLGDTAVMDGHEHVHANGNVYVLSMDAEGMWSAMYQKVMATVALGTQGSVTLERAEDMSWWLGSAAVSEGSEVNSDNGNTYTLWYTAGVWSAAFVPESMMIEGTGLTAMTREGDDMYDVADSTLPSTGVGDVMDGDAMYHVWMQDGALAGARFDKAIDTDTDYKVKLTSALPYLSANNADTVANETRTHLVITGDNESGMGMFSMGDLLGSGTATSNGAGFVSAAITTIEKVRGDVAALLALDTKPTGLGGILDSQWEKLNRALDKIFGTDSRATGRPEGTNRSSAVGRYDAPREEDLLDDIDDILDALASEANFVTATHTDRDNRGAFASQKLGAGKAADTFNRLTWSATATLGMTGSTRYGTVIRKMSKNAKSDPTTEDYGAFSYSTMEQTVRTADVVAPTGIASYSGGTEAITGAGKAYSGQMDLQVRFGANSVSGVVSNLMDADGLPWQHNFADVDRIVLSDATLRRNATWANPTTGDGLKRTGTVFYTADSGLLRPVGNQINTFSGRLLGQGADAGSEAVGVWSVGPADSKSHLAGGFGVVHVGDTARPLPSGDDGSTANSKLFTMVGDEGTDFTTVTIADGALTVKTRKFGWTGSEGLTYSELSDGDTRLQITAKFDLADLAAGSGSPVNGPKYVDEAIKVITAQREQLAILKGLDDSTTTTQAAEKAAWDKIVGAVRYNVFNGLLPVKLAGDYATSSTLKADALGLIDRVLDALSSNAKLEAALDPKSTGIFNKYWVDGNTNNTIDDGETHDFRYYDVAQRRYEVVNDNDTDTDYAAGPPAANHNGRTAGQIRGEREYKVISVLGTTEFTRFGIWRTEYFRSARRNGAGQTLHNHGGGPGTFAYSPLDKARAGTTDNLGFPSGGSARYEGETTALQNAMILTGTVEVGVTWNSSPAVGTAGTQAGTMSLTISGLANAAGDPLSDLGSDSSAGTEIADIVLPGLPIRVGGGTDYANNLLVTSADNGATLDEAAVSGIRYRRATAGQDLTGTGASVKALFVGQGVDGPLGVIGTWTLNDASVGRIAPDGSHTDDLNKVIYGAFGAEVP